MSEEQYKKKKKLLLLSIVCTIAIALGIGISYAFWQETKVQEETNVIASDCFDIELSGNKAINLAKAYPLVDESGMQTLPFTFTITNLCDYKTVYTINLESLATTTLQSSSLKVALDDSYKLYSNYKTTNKHFSDSKESRILGSGVLLKKESKTYNLRLWIDSNVPNTEQNKVFESKIVINSVVANENKTEPVNTFEVGDYIDMTPTSNNNTISTDLTGYTSEQTINPSELNLWRVIKKNDDGTVDVVSEYVSNNEVYLSGEVGYLNLVESLNNIASLYDNVNYVQSTRYMGFSTQIGVCSTLDECLSDTGYESDVSLVSTALGTLIGNTPSGVASPYWLASRSKNETGNNARYINEVGVISDEQMIGSLSNSPKAIKVRPIVTLKPNLEILDGDGKSADTAYTLK